ncbi:ATP-dependent helicase HrpB [Catenovulum sp. 2E275]|uniref:ATP-dependent helicase HrpB n=1 Tax=Catenovulum sp. 2E275 TaxID=2980497 RepID=UPI0021D31A90|nr:ATP-dependent helicase HrpB [Catenovulum sp. 2E275]MCU4674371.1 ATP-dependent helicase HrpB [Catenovulum sp. 2E275]
MLPIKEFIPEITKQLTEHSALVLQAEPGAGKSTFVPLALLQANLFSGSKIIMLEPRRMAAKSIATYLAKQLNETVGQSIGYQIRNESKISKQTRLEIVTEGVLTRRLQQDPELNGIGLIIFDEFHERSIHADLALMLSLEVQQAFRDDLKLLVMSATIDTAQISAYLNQAPVIKCPGRTYPVEVEYFAKTKSTLTEQVMSALKEVCYRQTCGDILVFLPGQADIKRCIDAAKTLELSQTELLPLYGALPLSKQELVLADYHPTQRRIIFATNIAETSLTIQGITAVIDSGLEKVLVYDVKSGLSRLETNYISKASATQRAGRAGRLQSGICFRLWGESQQNNLNEYQPEEILNSDLSSLVLELSAWGINQYQDVNWLTPAPLHHFQQASLLNQSLGLFDSHQKITPLGQRAAQFGLEPRLSSMLLSAQTKPAKQLACLLAALLSERDIFINADSSDITERLLFLMDYIRDKKQAQSQHIVRQNLIAQVVLLAKSFAHKLNIQLPTEPINLAKVQDLTSTLLLKAYPDRLAQLRAGNGLRYLLANGRGVMLYQTDKMQGEPWLVICDCDGKNKDGVVFSSAPIAFEQITAELKHQLVEHKEYALDAKKEAITGRLKLKYQALVLSENQLRDIPNHEFENCVKAIVKQEGLSFLNWSSACQNWLARAKWLGEQIDDFPTITEAELIKQAEHWLLPYLQNVKTLKQLKQVDIYNLLLANLTWEQQQFMAEQAPEFYVTPSDKKIAIRYDEFQGPTVAVILQEMFGQLESPKLAQAKVMLRFELLSPARRPIQTTSDLAHFWRNSYFDVAKDMRGKYPKHRWPEKPLDEKPGRSIKKFN